MYDQRSFIPTEATVTAIKSQLDININDLVFRSSDQTGGMVMCDVYTFKDAITVGVLSGEVFAIYDSLDQWHGQDEEGNEVEEPDYDTQPTAYFNAASYPDDNPLPALDYAARFWSAAKNARIISILQAKIDTGTQAQAELDVIKSARGMTS